MAESSSEESPGEDQDEANTEDGNQVAENNNVRRRIDFGDRNLVEDADDLSGFLHLSTEEMHRQRQKAIEKWNFDFENEIPLDGNWQWEKIPTQLPENKEIVCSLQNCNENRTV